MRSNSSLNNRNVALARWRNVRRKQQEHIDSISSQPEYFLMKARLHAFLVGDGCVCVNREKNGSMHHSFSFYPDHESLISLFVEATEYLYCKRPTVRQAINHYRLKVCSQFACEDLLQIGKYGSLDWHVPLELLNTRELKREWLRAFFDCEAYVNQKYLRIESVNKSGIQEVCALLAAFGVHTNFYTYIRKNTNWNVNYILCTGKKESRRRFLKEIGFNHPIKQEKLIASVAEPG